MKKEKKRSFIKFSFFKSDTINGHVYGSHSAHNCVLCGVFCKTDKHHALTKSKGGSEQDLVYLCPDCHRWCHNNPELAAAKGLYLKEYKITK